MNDMLPPKDKMCKFSGFTKGCRDLVCSGTCTDEWVHITGTDPQTGKQMDFYGCASQWMYKMAMDAARSAHFAGVDVQTLRNMIFDPTVRAKELAKASDMKTIEDNSCKSLSS